MGRTYTPQYMRIRNDIINRINNGELKKDQRLPSERDIADAFGVSRITVVGALHGLEGKALYARSAAAALTSIVHRWIMRSREKCSALSSGRRASRSGTAF